MQLSKENCGHLKRKYLYLYKRPPLNRILSQRNVFHISTYFHLLLLLLLLLLNHCLLYAG